MFRVVIKNIYLSIQDRVMDDMFEFSEDGTYVSIYVHGNHNYLYSCEIRRWFADALHHLLNHNP